MDILCSFLKFHGFGEQVDIQLNKQLLQFYE